jgi:hypothetical protein
MDTPHTPSASLRPSSRGAATARLTAQNRDIPHGGHQDNQSPPKVIRLILDYKPEMTDAFWLPVREFVVACALDMQLDTVPIARSMMQNLSQLAVWATRSAGLPLERRTLLRPPVIERFIREFHADKASATRHTYEGYLRKAAVTLGTGYGPGRITRMRGDIAPYEERELSQVLTWPRVQRRPETRRIGYALLGFCGGAGLRGIELSQLSASDVHTTGDGLEVVVSGASPRLVPVRREWEQYVRRAIDGLSPEQKIAYPESSENYRLSAIQHFGTKDTLRAPRPVRLRANFVVSIVRILPATDVMAIAGFKNAASLNPYLRAASLLGQDAVAAAVRNAGGPL